MDTNRNVDGSAGILADVTVGIQSGALLAVGVVMLVAGGVFLAIAVAIILTKGEYEYDPHSRSTAIREPETE